MVSVFRVPIALRLFLTVLFTTLMITTLSLGILHSTMQKNFVKYVADVETQKLDHLVNNLSDVYAVYGDWGNAIQAQIFQIEGQPDPEDYDRLSSWWLKRQYDISIQQSDFEQRSMIKTQDLDKTEYPRPLLNEEELRLVQMNLPSEYQPFEGIKFPLRENRNLFRRAKPNEDNTQTEPHKQIILTQDRLGLSSRLSLYDANFQFVVGEPSDEQLSFRPIRMNDQIVGYLGLIPTLNEHDVLSINFFSNQERYLFFVYGATFLLSLIAALVLATYFKQPIQRLLKGTRELTKGNYEYQISINRNDELGDLSQELNQLAVILNQHETSRRQWVADTSHELKTPLAVLQAQIEAMQDGIRKATPEHLNAMMNQVMSLKKLTLDLADLAQAEAMQLNCYLTNVNPWAVIQQEVEYFQAKFEQADLKVSLTGEETELELDLDRFKQIIANLLSNSIRYTEAGGKIHIHTTQTAQEWTVFFDDSPLGLSDEQLQHLGQRFYRVDDSRTRSTGGTGLGLALSCKIAQALGGQLTFAHSPLGGLRCQLTFPKKSNQKKDKS